MQWGIDYKKVQIPKNRDTFLERHAGYRDTLETEKYSYVPNLVKYVWHLFHRCLSFTNRHLFSAKYTWEYLDGQVSEIGEF